MDHPYVTALRRQFNLIDQTNKRKDGVNSQRNANLWKIPQLQNPPRLSQNQLKNMFRTNNDPFEEFTKLHCLSFTALLQNDVTFAWNLAQEQFKLCLKIIEKVANTSWYLPLVYSGLKLMRIVAVKHDEFVHEGGATKTLITDSLNLLRAVKATQKTAVFFVINQVLQLSFSTEQLSYCSTAIRVAHPFLNDLHSFPKSHVVQFKFYSGKHSMLEENYKEAKLSLEFAFKHCHKDSIKNKIKILELLIPINLLFGIFPNPELLKKYKIPHLQGLVEACREGDIRAFHKEVENFQQKYIEQGVYLLITHIDLLLYKKVIALALAVQMKRSQNRPNVLPFKVLFATLKERGSDMEDMDELECILSNLIWKGAVKGYIAHGKALVLSKDDPFPRLYDSFRFER